MANAQACSCTARSDATWASHSTRPGPSRVVAIPARLPGHTRRRQCACSPRRQAVTRGVVAASGAPSDVFILDFDGVLVDSEPEVSAPAWRLSARTLSVDTEMVRHTRHRSMRVTTSWCPVSGVNGGVPCSEQALDGQCHRRREGSGRRFDTNHDAILRDGMFINSLQDSQCGDRGAGAGGAEGDTTRVD